MAKSQQTRLCRYAGVADGNQTHHADFDFLTIILGFPLLLAVSAVPAWRNILSHSNLVKLGGFSYSLYLMHMPLLKLLITDWICPWPSLGSLGGYLVTLVTVVPAILLISYKFSMAFEQSFIGAGNRLATPEPLPVASAAR